MQSILNRATMEMWIDRTLGVREAKLMPTVLKDRPCEKRTVLLLGKLGFYHKTGEDRLAHHLRPPENWN